jgi:hypothetical protein
MGASVVTLVDLPARQRGHAPGYGPGAVHPGVAILLLAAANAVTVTLMLLVRRRAPEGSFFHDTTQATGVFTVAGTAYAVLLAFVFLLAFQSYNSARNAAEQEATATATLYHDADPFAPSIAAQLHGQIVCYARSVVYQEWPAMANGHASPVTQFWLARLDETIDHEQPRNVKQANADFNWTAIGLERTAGRRDRLQEARPLIPGLVWILLGIGSVVVVVFVLFFADKRERGVVQAMLMISVTTMLGVGLVMIEFFDDPYQDVPGSIKPEAMSRTLAMLEATRVEQRTPAPCTPKGLVLRRS